MKEWQCRGSERVFQCRVFNVRKDENCSLVTGRSQDCFIIEAAHWVNVIAITPANEVVIVKQYRYGSKEITIEIPGGLIDAGEQPEAAARRELLEETGYRSDHWQLLGVNEPNPAIQNNYCYTYLADQAYRVSDQQLDHNEEIELELIPFTAIPDLIISGAIKHALVITAFYYYEAMLKPRAPHAPGR